eukprot:7292940-Ditylum_brightwellii.AAC.1
MNAEPLHSVQAPSLVTNTELHPPEGGVPDGTVTDDISTAVTDLDSVQNEPVVCQNPHRAARDTLPEQHREYPYVIRIIRDVPSEITFQDVMAANHTSSLITTLPSYNDMAPQEVDRQ